MPAHQKTATDDLPIAEVKTAFAELDAEVVREREAEAIATAPTPIVFGSGRIQVNEREFGWLPAREIPAFQSPGGRFPKLGHRHFEVQAPDGRILERLDVPPIGTQVRLPNGLSVRPDQISPE